MRKTKATLEAEVEYWKAVAEQDQNALVSLCSKANKYQDRFITMCVMMPIVFVAGALVGTFL